ncbi:MipA/OmpV family protein [Marinimicrobium alkaliphilum]|uniref:MipA/OmpV family protein n=1 Tax=Marinimicrobium alkaliphilum TaxID=2202654 RepID=UPI000DB992E3|nr:MipA/OmpV family protein [Marinimicrobium alkaliphilum]
MRFFAALALGITALGASTVSLGCSESRPDCVAVGEWQVELAVGAGLRTNPLVDKSDIPLVLIPQVTYYGERFFIDYLDLGVTLVEQPRWMLNALVTPGSDGLYFFRRNSFVLDGGLRTTAGSPVNGAAGDGTNGLHSPNFSPPAVGDSSEFGDGWQEDNRAPSPESPDPAPVSESPQPSSPETRKRRIAGMAGLEASAQLGGTDWQLQVLQEFTGLHDGQEVRLAVGSGTRVGEHRFNASIGMSWKSSELLDYYYGVTERESHDGLPSYQARSGTSQFIRLGWTRPVSPRWRWLMSAQYEHLSDAITDSPLVDNNSVIQVFAGGVYHF